MSLAIILAPGFEEIEALTVVDVLRRAEIGIDMVGFEEVVSGAHEISVQSDKLLADVDLQTYEGIILPGGLPGAEHLRDHPQVIAGLQELHEKGKLVAAICAAPIALAEAGLLIDINYTCFPGFEEDIAEGQHQDSLVTQANNIITSRGPATALEFAYTIVDYLGGDSSELREGMQYNRLLK